MGRDRAVVDDPPASRLLAFHEPERLPCTEKHAREIGVHDRFPLAVGKILEGDSGRVDTGVVEQQIDATEHLFYFLKQHLHGIRIADIGGNGHRTRACP